VDQRRKLSSWTDALREFIKLVDHAGILVMVSGIVGNNTHRPLNTEEFRGFALSDQIAPLIFINGKDSKAAQMFTLAHELAHVWLGSTALSDVSLKLNPSGNVEKWCNNVAAELLVPLEDLSHLFRESNELPLELNRLARHFKVSTLVVLRRIHDAGFLSRDEFWQVYNAEVDKIKSVRTSGGGGFYRSLKVRVGRRLAEAIVVTTLEGQTLYTDAFQMLGVKKQQTFRDLSIELGVVN
jgi:Zn-dependent peptidase ImmA (M78 family)